MSLGHLVYFIEYQNLNIIWKQLMISFAEALKMAISELKKPVISKFEIYYLALSISKKDSYNGQLIRAQRKAFGFEKNSNLVRSLSSLNFIFQESLQG